MEPAAHYLSIPNREVRLVYGSVDHLLDALLAGNAEAVQNQLQLFVTDMLSYHDAALLKPAQVYHAFVLGLLASFETRGYRVRSNRESGQGRPDVLILPKEPGKPGVVLELKVVKPSTRTPEKTLAAALAQIGEKA